MGLNGLPPAYEDFVRFFAAGDYLAANQVLEHCWREHRDNFYKGVLQLAVALYQQRNGRPEGTRKLLNKALENLAPYAPVHLGVDVARLLSAVRASEWREDGAYVPGEAVSEMAAALRQPWSGDDGGEEPVRPG